MNPITSTITPQAQGLAGATGATPDIIALAAIAVAWGILISLVITILDMRSQAKYHKGIETWAKAAWALGLCFAPFLIFVTADIIINGLHNVIVDFSVAVQKGMESAGGTFIGHSGQNLAEKAQANKAATAAAQGAGGQDVAAVVTQTSGDTSTTQPTTTNTTTNTTTGGLGGNGN